MLEVPALFRAAYFFELMRLRFAGVSDGGGISAALGPSRLEADLSSLAAFLFLLSWPQTLVIVKLNRIVLVLIVIVLVLSYYDIINYKLYIINL